MRAKVEAWVQVGLGNIGAVGARVGEQPNTSWGQRGQNRNLLTTEKLDWFNVHAIMTHTETDGLAED